MGAMETLSNCMHRKLSGGSLPFGRLRAKKLFALMLHAPVVAVLLVFGGQQEVTARNLLPNPAFEELDEDGFPAEWVRHHLFKGEYSVKLDPEFARTGAISLGVSQSGPEAHENYTTLNAPSHARRIRVTGEREYTFSVWVKGTGRLLMSAYLYDRGGWLMWPPEEKDAPPRFEWKDIDAQEWEKQTIRLVIPEKGICRRRGEVVVEQFLVALNVRGGPLWFDDASVYLAGTEPEEEKNLVEPGKSPYMSIPRMPDSPVIDGVIGEDEWAPAAGTTGFFSLGGGLNERQTVVYAGHDEENLYVAFKSLHEGTFRRGSLREHFSQTEVFEIWLVPPGKGYYQVLVNPLGEVWDISEKDGSAWSSGADYGTKDVDSGEKVGGVLTFGKRIWTGEIALPFEKLGVPAPSDGEEWRINFTRNFSVPEGTQRVPEDWTTWSRTPSFSSIEQFGYGVFDRLSQGVKLEAFGDLASGDLHVKGEGGPHSRIQTLVSISDDIDNRVFNQVKELEQRDTFDVRQALKTIRPTGMDFYFAAYDTLNSRLLKQVRLPFTAMSAFAIKPVPVYFREMVRFEIDLSRLADMPEKAEVELEISKSAHASPQKRSILVFSPEKYKDSWDVDISGWPEDEYTVRGVLKNEKGEEIAYTTSNFLIPEKPVWWDNSLGVSDEVPLPWEEVEVNGDRVKITQREYLLQGSGLPSSMISLGKELLSNPAELIVTADGKTAKIDFEPLKLMDKTARYAMWEISGSSENMHIEGTLKIEFDGFALWEISVNPVKEFSIDKMHIDFPMEREKAKFAKAGLRSASITRDIYSEDDRWEEVMVVREGTDQQHSRMGWIWQEIFLPDIRVIDGLGRGLALVTETDENIRGGKYAEFIETEESVIFRINLISEPFMLDKPLRYEYAYMGMPVKPEPDEMAPWRTVYLGDIGVYRGDVSDEYKEYLDYVYGGMEGWAYLQALPPKRYHEMSSGLKAIMEKLRTQHDVKLAAGVIWPQAVGEHIPEYEIYGPEWRMEPSWGWGAPGAEGRAVGACLETSYPDFVLYVTNKLITEYGLDGIYTDVGDPVPCSREIHGNCGYYDSAGERQPTMKTWAGREFWKRLYTLLKSEGRDGIHFMHPGRSSATGSFADNKTFGEALGATREEQYRRVSPDMFRARYSAKEQGVPANIYPFHHYSWLAAKYGSEPVPQEEILMMCLPHRVLYTPMGVAPEIVPVWKFFDEWWVASEFIPYWSNEAPAVTNSPEAILASTFLKKEESKALVVVANWNYEPSKAEIEINPQKLGFSPGSVELLNLSTGEKVSVEKRDIKFELPSRDYRILRLME